MKRRLVSIALAFLPASLALADGVGPQRKMTEAESSAFKVVHDAVASAMPKAADGYKLDFAYVSEYGENMLPEGLKSDDMFRMRYTATYALEESAGGDSETSLFMDKAKGTPEQQAKLAELDAKDEQLRKARNQTHDRAEKDKIRARQKAVQEEVEKLRGEIMAQYQAWVASGGPAAAVQEHQQSLPPGKLTIEVLINADVSLNVKASPMKIEGAPLAFEQNEGCDGYDTCCFTVFLGPFQKTPFISDHDRYKLAPSNLGVSTKVRGICLTVGGPKAKPEAARTLLGQIDLAKLKALLP